jgi:hypothetical protein
MPDGGPGLPRGYTVEELTELPCNLAMTELAVRPCVAYLKTPAPSAENRKPDASRDLLPKLNAKEVTAVFTAPFFNFLREKDLDPETRETVPGEWYKGSWHSWHESAWRMHQFFIPVSPSTVFLANPELRRKNKRPRPTDPSSPQPTAQPAPARETTGAEMPKTTMPTTRSRLQPPLPQTFYSKAAGPLQEPRYRVFGMTARILVDCARVAYGEEPEFEHNSHFGDEMMIEKLLKIGRLAPVKKEGEALTRDVMMKADREVKL